MDPKTTQKPGVKETPAAEAALAKQVADLKAQLARAQCVADPRGDARLHRVAASQGLRLLGARKWFGTRLSRRAVVDDGVLVAGAAQQSAAGAGPPRRDQPAVRRRAGFNFELACGKILSIQN